PLLSSSFLLLFFCFFLFFPPLFISPPHPSAPSGGPVGWLGGLEGCPLDTWGPEPHWSGAESPPSPSLPGRSRNVWTPTASARLPSFPLLPKPLRKGGGGGAGGRRRWRWLGICHRCPPRPPFGGWPGENRYPPRVMIGRRQGH